MFVLPLFELLLSHEVFHWLGGGGEEPGGAKKRPGWLMVAASAGTKLNLRTGLKFPENCFLRSQFRAAQERPLQYVGDGRP